MFIINVVFVGIVGIVLIGRFGIVIVIVGEGYDMDVIVFVVIGGILVVGGFGFVFKIVIGVLFMSVINNSFNFFGIDVYF